MRELVHGAVGVDGRGFAEQNHRDGAKRNRDDRLSEVRFMDLCEVLKVQYLYGPVAQLVRAPPCHGGGHGFESRLGRLIKYGILAQLGEHLPYKQRVIGSSPIGPIPFMPMWLNWQSS